LLCGVLFLFLPGSVLACATCGCTLSGDAAMGYLNRAGWRISLQYDYIDQNELRSGHDTISPAAVAALNEGRVVAKGRKSSARPSTVI
jgi:hypothetical protein